MKEDSAYVYGLHKKIKLLEDRVKDRNRRLLNIKRSCLATVGGVPKKDMFSVMDIVIADIYHETTRKKK